MKHKYYRCINHKKEKLEHRMLAETSPITHEVACSCGFWYEEVSEQEYLNVKNLDITHE